MYAMMNRNHNIHTHNPWQEMEAFRRAFWGAPRHRCPQGQHFPQGQRWHQAPGFAQIRTDITDKGDHFLLESDLPGFAKEDIAVEVRKHMLTVRAERKQCNEEKDDAGKVIRSERTCGSYCRRFHLRGVDAENITAKYENGVLRLTLPKLEKPKAEGRLLEIE